MLHMASFISLRKGKKKKGGGLERDYNQVCGFVFTHQDLAEMLKVCCSQEAPRMNPPDPTFILRKKKKKLNYPEFHKCKSQLRMR